jgi:hypothetical protein
MPIHLLIDWENERPTGAELELVRGSRFRLWILHGPQQNSFTAEQVSAWQPLGKQVRFVQSIKSGKNALDMHIAYCIGVASEHDRQQEAQGCYVVVSRDKGFDALFGYLGSRDIRAGRAESLTGALLLAAKLMEGVQPKPASKSRMSESAARVFAGARQSPDDHQAAAEPHREPTRQGDSRGGRGSCSRGVENFQGSDSRWDEDHLPPQEEIASAAPATYTPSSCVPAPSAAHWRTSS